MKLRTFLQGACAWAALVAPVPAVAQHPAAHTAIFQFDQPSENLADALIAFSRTTQLQIASSSGDLSHLRSGPVEGPMSAQAALNRMTASLPVEARIQGGAVIISRRQPAPVSPPKAVVRQAPAKEPEPAVALDTPPSAIVVTGYRQSVDSALKIKKDAIGSEEVILSDDIANFPDQNLADALQRVPGVAITRENGEGRQISLRGLGPDFTRTQMNGMEVLSNTASGLDSRGGVSRNRSFDYSVFASELFNQVVVEKSYAASQDEGGIGGTVSLRTAKPFDYPGLTIVANGKAQVNQYTSKATPRLVGLISDRWGDFGMLVSAAYSRADTIEWGYRNWNWSQINFGANNVGPDIPEATRDLLVDATGSNRVWNSRAQTYATWYDRRDRLGLTGTLQYHPGNHTDVTLDVLYGRFKNRRDENVLGNAGTNGLSANDVRGTQVVDAITIDSHNSITGATVSGVDLRSESKPTRDQTDFWQVVLNGRTDVTDRLELTGLAGWSRSTFNSSYAHVYLESVGHTVSFSGLDTAHPVNSYDFDPADPAAWALQAIDKRADKIDSQFYNAKGGLKWTVSPSSDFQAGAEFKRFDNSGYRYASSVNYEGMDVLSAVPAALTQYSTEIPYIVANVPATLAALGQDAPLTSADLAAGTDYRVREQTFAAYAQYDLHTHIGGVGLRANLGVRYYRTKLDSSGSLAASGGLVPVDITHHYNGFLPALNVAFDVGRSLIFRFSANRNISRPALGDLSAAGSVNASGFGGTITAGNPDLTPYIADSVEGTVEFYDGKRGFLSAGAFYKKMKSFVTTETATVPYGETGYPLDLLEPGQDGSIIYNYKRPVNTPGASIHGIELAAKRDFDFLPGPLRALGVLANLTYADGKTNVFYNGVPRELSLVALSRWSYNATLYYDTKRGGARISMASRSRYRSGDGGNNNVGEYFAPTTFFDATAYWNLTPRVQFRVEGLNLTNQRIVEYADIDAHRLMTSSVSGRTISFGASVRF